MSARPVIDAATNSDLFHKAIAIRTQLQLHETESALFLSRAELAQARGRALEASLPPLEMQLLAALDAPAGARFNWATFTYDDPPNEGAPREDASAAGWR